MYSLQTLIKEVSPPFLVKALKKFLPSKYGWFGNYSSWAEAEEDAIGYDSTVILEKVKASALKVKNGEAVYERDSVLFNQSDYSWPLIACLLWIITQNKCKLNLLDFGGSLGSTYYQNRIFLNSISQVSWNVVEQKNFVKCGRESFQDETLQFFYSIEECLELKKPDTILLSCVLPYLEHPYVWLEKILDYKFPYLLLDRMPYIFGKNDRLTIQKVPPDIYPASYPSWFFSEEKMATYIKQTYECVFEFDCKDVANIPSRFKGALYKLK
jgi:putative methyltransferase (TIGR04325 family)